MEKKLSKKIQLKIILALVIVILAIIFFSLGGQEYLTLEFLKANLEKIQNFYQLNKFIFIISYFFIYIITTALSFPGATVLSLAGAATMGFTPALIIVSFASTIGATISFLLSRYFFRDYIHNKYAELFVTINKGVEQQGALYLLSLRLMPIFPFFLINILMGLTNIKVLTYYLVSQIGMFLGTVVYINAGVQLSKIESIGDIFSPILIFSFMALGLLPLIGRKLSQLFLKKK